MDTEYKEEITRAEKYHKFIVHYGKNGKHRDVIEFQKAKTTEQVLKMIKGCTVVYALD